ncbi:MAG: hypothetical protein EOM25_15235, partial [Deltaproteobacteria bacterium]|nr:hypothetical protein [Deltaproteobacteria bacterium]
MGRTHLIVSATSLEEARDQAVSELGVPADDMTVIALDDGRYRAELVNHDADVEVEISPDKSFVTIAAYIPARGTGRP